MLTPTGLAGAQPAAAIDLDAAEQAAGQFLRALGMPVDSESLQGTPGRMARAYAELFTPQPFQPTTFPNDEGYDELVLARAIPVRSVCEHHLLADHGPYHLEADLRWIDHTAARLEPLTRAVRG
jgi:GTP cyclohydrolase IA